MSEQENIVPNDVEGIKFDKDGNPIASVTQEQINQDKLDKLFRSEKKKLSNLKDSGNKLDDAALSHKIRQRFIVKDLEVHKQFTNPEEQKLAKDLTKRYLEEFIPKTISDINNLKSVIYLEVLQKRLQDVMNELAAQGASAIPLNLVDSIHKNLKELAANKERLGLIGQEREDLLNDGYKHVQSLKEKFKEWRNRNQGSRTLICPHCGKMTMLKIRMDKWIAQEHPFFKDRFLANKHLMKLYITNKLSKEDVSLILNSSTDYIDWLIETLWMTDPEYRKEFRKYDNKKLKELEIKLQEAEQKAKEKLEGITSGEDLESGELESGQVEELPNA
jgi:hypothetical protein